MEKLTIKQKLLLRKLKDHGLSEVSVSYSGGGDDGCIDDISGYTIDEDGRTKYQGNDGIPDNFITVFEDLFYDMISKNVEWDWVNNEGGFGSLYINVDTGAITIEHSQRVVEEHTYNIHDDEFVNTLDNGSSISTR